VQLFFVLSGFIVALPFARHWLEGTAAPDLKRYLLRRLKRIEPLTCWHSPPTTFWPEHRAPDSPTIWPV